jgi:hypothetical protein
MTGSFSYMGRRGGLAVLEGYDGGPRFRSDGRYSRKEVRE